MTAAGLVLAAGAGRRFGSPKALVAFAGTLLVDRAVDTLRAAGCDPVVVVLGAGAAEVVAASTRLDDTVVVVNDGWADGMGGSLRCGLAALDGLGAPAAVITLVDQPGVTAPLVRRLVETWLGRVREDGVAAVVATYAGRPRNPVLLVRSVWPEVSLRAHGDKGAREWLRAHPDAVVEVACDDLGSDADIDTLDDLTHLLEDSP